MSRSSIAPGSLVALTSLLLIASVAVGTAGAGGQVDSTPGAATPARGTPLSGEPLTIAFLNPYPQTTFWQVVQTAFTDYATANGQTVVPFALGAASVPEQLAQFDRAIADEVDGIVVGLIDAVGSVPGIVAANSAGIPVVAVLTEPAGGEIVTLIKPDDEAAARAAGEYIQVRLGEVGTVLNLQGNLESDEGHDRDRGLREAFTDQPGIRVVSRPTFWSEVEAYQVTLDFFPAQPGADDVIDGTPAPQPPPPPGGVFAANETITRGALAAIEVRGYEDPDSIVVGFGSILDAVELVRAGGADALVVPFPARMGTVAADVIIRHLRGDAIPAMVDPGFALVTEENIDRFAPLGTPIAEP